MAARPENAEMPVDQDTDPQETQEWQDALTGVIEHEGTDRAHFLIEQMIAQAREEGIDIPYSATTEYINTIPADRQPKYPGDADIEIRIRNYIRWNAMAMVVRANRDSNVGGHIASFASSAALYDVGFNWFWRAQTENHGGDLIFFQGHSIPGVYSRAFLMDRLTEEQLNNFRQEVGGKGLSSYPHPWLMPDFWRFPTVSMGLGPIQAIYQARFMKYMDSRGFIDAKDRKVWAFLGDGETDEVESLGAIGMAARERTPVRISHMTHAALYSHAIRESMDAHAAPDAPPLRGMDIPYPGLPEPHSQVAVPLLSAGRLLGVLFAESPEDMRFGFEDEDLLVAIAGQLAAAIDLLQAAPDAPEPLPAPTAARRPPYRKTGLRPSSGRPQFRSGTPQSSSRSKAVRITSAACCGCSATARPRLRAQTNRPNTPTGRPAPTRSGRPSPGCMAR